ncbi:CHAT domain-containing protein [Burkholderia ubonensis]|uniref:CHAT domain-containing protein n=1 Tax=Burkholderia ubonensis TaxID=101571 RepID=UPI0008FDEE52|nr:CHAT domain-containing protein [Burkholderia ubonensis]OJA84422.1 hypothetical protein BGV49_21885 [Burkholderia ubonensis]
MRGLFTGEFDRIRCPACGSAIAFEPGVLVVGIDPPAAYFSGGDALTTEQTRNLARELQKQAASEGPSLDVQTFESQPDLLVALLERLRLAARAMKPLNAANAKGELARFMAEHWRTITPEVLVASDVVTLVEHLAKDSEEDRLKGTAYFSAHSGALGRLQAMSWLALCNSHGGRSPSSAHTLEDNLAAYVAEGVLFDTACGSLEEAIRNHEAQGQGLEHWLVSYCMHAVLARARKLRKQPNTFGEDWTVRWMELEYLLRSEEADLVAQLQPCELSVEAVAGTLQRKAMFNVAVQRLAPFLDGESPAEVKRWANELQPICEKAGYPDLGVDIVQNGIVFEASDMKTAAQAIELLDRMAANAASMGRSKDPISEQMLTTACGELIAASDAESVRRVFEHVSKTVADDETRGTLESWLGATLLRMHREQQFLDVVGAEERDWEARLTDSTKGRLWTERANALRAAGRVKETLAWRRRALQMYQNEPRSNNYRTATRMLSIAERETGAPDRARDLILALLEDDGALDRVTMLETASATWLALGDRQKACAALEEAIELATGPEAHRKQQFQASLASLRYEADVVAIERALLETPRSGWNSPITLLQECAAWLNLQMRGHQPSAEGQARYGEALAALSETLKSGDMPAAWREQAFVVLAMVAEETQLDNAYESWGAAADAADALGMVPQPAVVLALAALNYRADDKTSARRILRTLPAALARDVERLDRIEVALDTLTPLGPKIDELTSYLVEHGLLFDARVVAEYRRDRLRRAVSRRNIAQDSSDFLAGKLFAPVVAGGQAVVLEFLQLTDGWAPVLTWQPAGEARVRSQPLEAPDFDVVELRDRIVNRLQGWVRGRPSDPFNVAHWTEFCGWLRTSIGEALPEPSHLVVIEAEGLEGIPFHVAVAPEWTCSYASSWMSLHTAISAPKVQLEQMGFAMVPAYADDTKVAAAMHAAGRSLKGLADRVRVRYDESIGAACDKDALSALLAESGVAFVACHGFLYEDGDEVAWVLAHRGGLPGKSGTLVHEGESAVNHLSWRDIERLESTPRIVFSAACSSGRAILAGLGERIGLYQSLSSRGTQTLVAPAWDVEADLVMPIAVRALELHLERPMTLANAVREACSAANKDLPAWCAWPLTIEGAWL